MRTCAAILIALSLAAPAFAQESAGDVKTPADVISFLVTNTPNLGGDTHAFEKDQQAAAETRDTITRALLVNLVSVPIATSSSGFVYRLDPELGTMTRVSDSFGTFFVERAMTSGRGRTSFGMSATTAGYDRLDGLNLRDGSLVTTANQFEDEQGHPFDTESLTLKIRTSTLTLFGTYGVTDRFEIGGAVPLVQLHLEGSSVNVYRGDAGARISAVADASGIADIALRTKFTLVSVPGAGFAAGAEVRLPTGDEANLLGAGRAALRLLAIGSMEHARVGLHGNFAFVQGGISDEIDGSGALTIAVTPRVTATGEFLLRHFSDLRTIGTVSALHPTFKGQDPITGEPVPVETLRLAQGTAKSVLSTLVSGVKWNVKSSMVLTGQVQWPVGNGGLTAPFTPTISLDYLF